MPPALSAMPRPEGLGRGRNTGADSIVVMLTAIRRGTLAAPL